MSELKAEFEFEIGDVVFAKDAIFSENLTPNNYTVAERIIMECHGGTQTFFKFVGSERLVQAFAYTKDVPELDSYGMDARRREARDEQFAEVTLKRKRGVGDGKL